MKFSTVQLKRLKKTFGEEIVGQCVKSSKPDAECPNFCVLSFRRAPPPGVGASRYTEDFPLSSASYDSLAELVSWRAATQIGIAEEVDLLTEPATMVDWNIQFIDSSGSVLVAPGYPKTGQSAEFTAPIKEGTITVTADCGCMELTKTFEVIGPEANFQLVAGEAEGGVLFGESAIGYDYHNYVYPIFGPPNVSFYNCEVWEGDQPASNARVSGGVPSFNLFYSEDPDATVHAGGTIDDGTGLRRPDWIANDGYLTPYGTRVWSNIDNNLFFFPREDVGSSSGEVSFDIPWHFRRRGSSTTPDQSYTVPVRVRYAYNSRTRTLTNSKGGVTTHRSLDSAATGASS